MLVDPLKFAKNKSKNPYGWTFPRSSPLETTRNSNCPKSHRGRYNRKATLSQSSLRLFRQPGSYWSARGQQRLALTELELVTLALARLNAITDAFWWHKPLGVREPMRIYCKTEPIAEERSADLVADEVPEISTYYVISLVSCNTLAKISAVPSLYCSRGSLCYMFLFFVSWLFVLPILSLFLLAATILLLPLFTLLFLVSFIFTAVSGIVTSSLLVLHTSRHLRWQVLTDGRIRFLWGYFRRAPLPRMEFHIPYTIWTASLACISSGNYCHPIHGRAHRLHFGEFWIEKGIRQESSPHPRSLHDYPPIYLHSCAALSNWPISCTAQEPTTYRFPCGRLDPVHSPHFSCTLVSPLNVIPWRRNQTIILQLPRFQQNRCSPKFF